MTERPSPGRYRALVEIEVEADSIWDALDYARACISGPCPVGSTVGINSIEEVKS